MNRHPKATLSDTSDLKHVTPGQKVVMSASAALIVALFGLTYRTQPTLFSFHTNAYALISFVSLLTCVVLQTLIGRIKASSDYLLWFSFYVAAVTILAGTEFLQRLSTSASTASFWASMNSIGGFLMPAFLFLFVLAYTNPRRERHRPTILWVFWIAIFSIFFDFHTRLFSYYQASQLLLRPWGYVIVTGPYYALVIVWIEVLYVTALVLLIRFYRSTLQAGLKKQAKLFIIAILVPLIGGTLSDGILPIFGIHILPLAVMLLTVMNVIVSYGILRYRFFVFSPAVIATSILETMNEAVVGISPELKINYVNKGAQKLFGYSTVQFGKLNFRTFLTNGTTEADLETKLFKPLQRGIASHYESINLKRADGQEISVKISASNILQDDELSGYILVITDISQLTHAREIIEQTVVERTEELRETQSELVAAMRSLPFGFGVINQEDQFTIANAHLPQLLNRTIPGDLTASGQTLVEISQEFLPDIDLLATIHKSRDTRKPIEKTIASGTKFFRFLFMPVLKQEKDVWESLGTAMIMEDVTEAKATQRSRDEFFSIASHELRTPLTTIRGNTSMILDYYKETLKDESVAQMVHDIHNSSVHLIDIVNDFLDMSSLEQHKVVFNEQSFDLTDTIQSIADEYSKPATDKGIKLKFSHKASSKAIVYADPNRCRQIMGNLVGNAIKFTTEGSVEIEIDKIDDTLHISVVDSGQGIPAETQHLLFRKFQQATDNILTRDNTKGTGLGLYISRLLAENMHGKLYLKSSVADKGSTFTLELPTTQTAYDASVADVSSGKV